MPIRSSSLLGAATLALAGAAVSAQAADGKLLLTGGVSTLDGAAGGGLTPWAVTGSYATRGQWGVTAHATRVKTQHYALATYGAAIGWNDRIEVSLAAQDFDTGDNLAPISPALAGLHLKQAIVGVKLRVAGDVVLDSDTLMPQFAVGVLHKKAKPGALGPALDSFGAKDSGTELYVSATKLLLAQSLLVNGTLRATKANQNGLLGFGSAANGSYQVQPEISLALLVRKNVAVGAEFRAKPDNLNPSPFGDGLKEDDWFDVFVAWAPNKHVSLTLAYVDLGKIAPAVVSKRQTGTYLSVQIAF